jgi:hypothetical protein
MRFIFFTLLIINACMAAYLYRSALMESKVPALSAPVSLPDSFGSLVLLSEVERTQAIETVRLRVSDNAVSSPTMIQSVVNDELSAESDDVGGVEVSNSCVRVGAFIDMEEAKYFVAKLAAKGIRSEVKNVLVSTTVGFWLHLLPLSSKKALRRRLAELQRQGIDSYTIPDGELANGISLGMFSERQRAKSLQKSISQLGYRPEIAEVPREKREPWVFVLEGEEQKISDQMWFEWLSVKELAKKQEILCSDVASA